MTAEDTLVYLTWYLIYLTWALVILTACLIGFTVYVSIWGELGVRIAKGIDKPQQESYLKLPNKNNY
jgi:hypothetical protein